MSLSRALSSLRAPARRPAGPGRLLPVGDGRAAARNGRGLRRRLALPLLRQPHAAVEGHRHQLRRRRRLLGPEGLPRRRPPLRRQPERHSARLHAVGERRLRPGDPVHRPQRPGAAGPDPVVEHGLPAVLHRRRAQRQQGRGLRRRRSGARRGSSTTAARPTSPPRPSGCAATSGSRRRCCSPAFPPAASARPSPIRWCAAFFSRPATPPCSPIPGR